MSSDSPPLLFHHNLLAGAFTAICTSLLFTPLDVVKDVVRKVIKNEGYRSLWRGLQPALLISIPSMGMYMLTYHFYFIEASIDKVPKDLIIPISGASARVCIVTCSLPIEFLRTNLQANHGVKWHQVIRNTVNVSIFKLWTGLFPTLLRDVPFSSFYWYSYDYHRRFLIKYFENYIANINTRRVTAEFISGICSGSIAAFITAPFDVVKTQLQSNIHNKESSLQVAKRIYSVSGYRGFFSGAQARVLKVGPACGVGITCYEIFKRYYGKQYLVPNNL